MIHAGSRLALSAARFSCRNSCSRVYPMYPTTIEMGSMAIVTAFVRVCVCVLCVGRMKDFGGDRTDHEHNIMCETQRDDRTETTEQRQIETVSTPVEECTCSRCKASSSLLCNSFARSDVHGHKCQRQTTTQYTTTSLYMHETAHLGCAWCIHQ